MKFKWPKGQSAKKARKARKARKVKQIFQQRKGRKANKIAKDSMSYYFSWKILSIFEESESELLATYWEFPPSKRVNEQVRVVYESAGNSTSDYIS